MTAVNKRKAKKAAAARQVKKAAFDKRKRKAVEEVDKTTTAMRPRQGEGYETK